MIQKLWTSGLPLHDQLLNVQDVLLKLNKIQGDRGCILQTKAEKVFTKNAGLGTLKDLNDALIHGTPLASDHVMFP